MGRRVVGQVVRVEVEVGPGLNGSRAKARSMLAGPAVTAVVVEHRDRLGRMNTELVECALAASGWRLVVLDDGEAGDGLVRDLVGVLNWFCARRSTRSRVLTAVGCARRDIGPAAVAGALGARWVPEVAKAKKEARRLAGELTPGRVRTRIDGERGSAHMAGACRGARLVRRAVGSGGG